MSKKEKTFWYSKLDLAFKVVDLARACHDRNRRRRALNKIMAIDDYLYSRGIR